MKVSTAKPVFLYSGENALSSVRAQPKPEEISVNPLH